MTVDYMSLCSRGCLEINKAPCPVAEDSHHFNGFVSENHIRLFDGAKLEDLFAIGAPSGSTADHDHAHGNMTARDYNISTNMLYIIRDCLPVYFDLPEVSLNDAIHCRPYIQCFLDDGLPTALTTLTTPTELVMGITLADAYLAGYFGKDKCTDEEVVSHLLNQQRVDIRTLCLTFYTATLDSRELAVEKFSLWLSSLEPEEAYTHVSNALIDCWESLAHLEWDGENYGIDFHKCVFSAVYNSQKFSGDDMMNLLKIVVAYGWLLEVFETPPNNALECFKWIIKSSVETVYLEDLVDMAIHRLLTTEEKVELLHLAIDESFDHEGSILTGKLEICFELSTEYQSGDTNVVNSIHDGETAVTRVLKLVSRFLPQFDEAELPQIYENIEEALSNLFSAADLGVKNTNGEDAECIARSIDDQGVRDKMLEWLGLAISEENTEVEDDSGSDEMEVDSTEKSPFDSPVADISQLESLKIQDTITVGVTKLEVDSIWRDPSGDELSTLLGSMEIQDTKQNNMLSDILFPIHNSFGNEQVVKWLLSLGYDINEIDADGYAPLHRALGFSGTHHIMMLIQNGADVNKSIEDGCICCTPIGFAIKNQNSEHLEILLQHGADRFKVGRCGTYFHTIVKTGNLRLLEIFLCTPTCCIEAIQRLSDGYEPKTDSLESNIKFCLQLLEKGIVAVQQADTASGVAEHAKVDSIVEQIKTLSGPQTHTAYCLRDVNEHVWDENQWV
ncbi:hypothetical protein ABW19_dt0208371 [Dactylella cylindrospora]|nr:hypothetical protein ABW19_dt0208371 [Dactylella cylindrospora]